MRVRGTAERNERRSLRDYVLLTALMSRNACNGENGEKSPAAGD